MSDIKNYKCPNCGNSVVFEAESGKFRCTGCLSEFDESEASVSFVGTSAKDAINSDETTFQADLREYHCNNCGAELIVDATTTSSFCMFCKSPIVLSEKLSGRFAPKKLIPFKLTEKQAKNIFYKWIKSRLLSPKEFKNSKTINEIKGIYAPFWLFNSNSSGTIWARATKVKKWSDFKNYYTETSYYDISRSADIQYENVPIDSSTKLDDKLMQSIEPYNYDAIIDFNTAYLSGFFSERHDADYNNSKSVADMRIRTFFEKRILDAIHGYSTIEIISRNYTHHNMQSTDVMMPVYFLNIKYENKFYTFMINGQTGHIYGNPPLSKTLMIFYGVLLFFSYAIILYIAGGMIYV